MRKMSPYVVAFLFTLAPSLALSAENEQDKEAIQKTIETYLEAFHKGDAKALADHWAENGDYIDATGRHLKGREAIQKEYEEFFKRAQQPKLDITLTSLYFAADDLVIEDGVRNVFVAPNRPPMRIRYTAVHVKQDGKWLVQSVRDAVSFEPSNYEYLRDLEWTIGDWIDEDESGTVIQSSCVWSENRNFIVRTFSTSSAGQVLISGTQWLGWDPARKQIRSWLFDSKGSIGEAVWTQEGNKWVVNSETTLMDGSGVKETHIITRLDTDSIQWESKNRIHDGKSLPDTKEVTVKRQK